MLLKRLSLLAASILLVSIAIAQTTIEGRIIDQAEQPIAYASVHDTIHFANATSDDQGWFSITVDTLPIELFVQHISYTPAALWVHNDSFQTITLSVHSLEEVVVASTSPYQQAAEKISINKSLVKILPSLGSEVDFIRSLVLFPGVSTGEEVSKGITVRGGSLDQNITYINGVQSSNTGHLFNTFSNVPSVGVEQVALYKTGMPSRYGNALSSATAIELRAPSKQVFSAELGATNSKITYENTLGKQKKSSFLLSARSSYIDLLRQKAQDETLNNFNLRGANAEGPQYHFGYIFYDGLASLHLDLGNNWKAKAFGLHSYDRNIYIYNREYITYLKHELWNGTYGVNLEKKWSPETQLNFSSGLNFHAIQRYENNKDFLGPDVVVSEDFLRHRYGYYNWNSLLTFRQQLSTVQYEVGLFQFFKNYEPGDGSFHNISFDPILRTRDESFIENNNEQFGILLAGAFANISLPIGRRWTIDNGWRMSTFFSTPDVYYALEPRLNINFQATERWKWHAAFDYATQFDHGLVLSEVGLDNIILLPSVGDILPAKASNYALGTSFKSKDRQLAVAPTVFYKDMNNIQRLALDGKDNIVSDSLNDLVLKNGSGYAYGFELQVSYQTDTWLLNSAYTYARSYRHFDDFNENEDFPFQFDKPHEWNLIGIWGIGKKHSFSFNFHIANGARYTLPSGAVYSSFGNRPTLLYQGHQNEQNLPFYHRLDIGYDYNFPIKKHWQGALKINITNVYNHRNTNFVEIKQGNNQGFVAEAVSFVPILPSINFSVRYE